MNFKFLYTYLVDFYFLNNFSIKYFILFYKDYYFRELNVCVVFLNGFFFKKFKFFMFYKFKSFVVECWGEKVEIIKLFFFFIWFCL